LILSFADTILFPMTGIAQNSLSKCWAINFMSRCGEKNWSRKSLEFVSAVTRMKPQFGPLGWSFPIILMHSSPMSFLIPSRQRRWSQSRQRWCEEDWSLTEVDVAFQVSRSSKRDRTSAWLLLLLMFVMIICWCC
jgi:hypothetical protein